MPKHQRDEKHQLSVPETLKLWSGVELRVVGLFRASGERSAVAAVSTLAGFVVLVLKHAPLHLCLVEAALGAALTWMMTPKNDAKS